MSSESSYEEFVDWESEPEEREQHEIVTTLSYTNQNRSSDIQPKCHHVYLLNSLDPSHPHKTYIGYTTNPERRLRQHNGILKSGGARRTKRSGRPWSFVCIVHGLLNERMALQLEWAFQHCFKSTVFRDALVNQLKGCLDASESDSEDGNDSESSSNDADRIQQQATIEASMIASAKSLAKLFHSRRGVKARLQVLHILLCYGKPYKDLPLQIFFFRQEHAQIFQELLEEDYEKRCEDLDPSKVCQVVNDTAYRDAPIGLPRQMKCRVVSDLKALPFWSLSKNASENLPTPRRYSYSSDNSDSSGTIDLCPP